MTFHWAFTLPQGPATAVGLGTTDLSQSNGVLPMHVDSGASGSDVVGNPPAQDIALGNGSVAVNYNEGPFLGDFPRTGAIGDPIQFWPGTVTVTSTTVPGGIALQLLCTPTGTAPMVLTDQQGPTPPPSSTTAPEASAHGCTDHRCHHPWHEHSCRPRRRSHQCARPRRLPHPQLLYVGLFCWRPGSPCSPPDTAGSSGMESVGLIPTHDWHAVVRRIAVAPSGAAGGPPSVGHEPGVAPGSLSRRRVARVVVFRRGEGGGEERVRPCYRGTARSRDDAARSRFPGRVRLQII